eukprot:PLAT3662.29.p1 GENE.PLAT3662.29~~PLAT3662.29.p1  ORF type:complete len:211 (+),score=72.99 PLAT3662.29:1172-1804(+)
MLRLWDGLVCDWLFLSRAGLKPMATSQGGPLLRLRHASDVRAFLSCRKLLSGLGAMYELRAQAYASFGLAAVLITGLNLIDFLLRAPQRDNVLFLVFFGSFFFFVVALICAMIFYGAEANRSSLSLRGSLLHLLGDQIKGHTCDCAGCDVPAEELQRSQKCLQTAVLLLDVDDEVGTVRVFGLRASISVLRTIAAVLLSLVSILATLLLA